LINFRSGITLTSCQSVSRRLSLDGNIAAFKQNEKGAEKTQQQFFSAAVTFSFSAFPPHSHSPRRRLQTLPSRNLCAATSASLPASLFAY
jgi:hypothetical protein